MILVWEPYDSGHVCVIAPDTQFLITPFGTRVRLTLRTDGVTAPLGEYPDAETAKGVVEYILSKREDGDAFGICAEA